MSVIERDWPGAITSGVGGILLAVGAWLPWITLFAGLQRYSGVAGLYGRIVFAGGVLCVVGALGILLAPARRLRSAIGALGVALFVLALWELAGLHGTMHDLAGNPLLVARPGAGLYVVLCGAIVVVALLLPTRAAHE